ncbi:SDR family NAD(P)-dependent oxidoreductase [Ferrimonas balearica]|uniref:SDR family NAD(P)-dependent oxidoreductase n=1 Tax=Ferrimonas balearica TaxID=44012 RepID=UPI001C947887|nr:SDR family NAD(P)-dependent oxidoreductase [Ferrimonas balearica]MBY5979379.1 SDR family NAD(P)-dependent oxidoreductase [Ferrimonas balearica]
MTANTLIVGAGSAIGRAMAELALARNERVVGLSRDDPEVDHARFQWMPCDHSDPQRAHCLDALMELPGHWHRVVICLGLLHNDHLQPERRLEHLSGEALAELYQVNAILPQLYLADLLPLLVRQPNATVAVLSARVGSIGDNQLGGWYGYRAAKAGLNMLLRCSAIELSRRAPAVKLMAYHPGTVVSPLSEPFAANRPRLSPLQSATVLQRLMDEAVADGELSFVDWTGSPVPW